MIELYRLPCIPMKIFLSGCAGHLAQALLPRLCDHPQVESVVGVDLLPTAFCHPRFTAHRLDYACTEAHALLSGCDGLAHLGFTVLRGKMDERRMWLNNVAGSQVLLESARSAGIRRIVHVSSAAVYGSGENLSETAPFAPLAGFLYARHKAELESWLRTSLPEAMCLRPHIILGPHALPLLRFLLRQPAYLRLPDPQPLLQCVHEQDVASAIITGLMGETRGAFNLAAEDTFSFRGLIRARHVLPLALPAWLVSGVLSGLWHLSGIGGEPGWLEAADRSLTLDCARARRELGWQPVYGAARAVEETLSFTL